MNVEIGIDRENRDGIELVALAGELDIATAPRVERELGDAFDATRRGLVLDLTDLSYFDSTGINLFAHTSRRAEMLGIKLAVVSPAPHLRRLIDLSGMSNVLALRESRAAALEYVLQGRPAA